MIRFFLFLFVSSFLSLPAEEILSPSTEIYVPSPQFKDLNRPTTEILDLPPMRNYHGAPGIAAPGRYSHYQYLYFRPYNYRMQAYPYMYYQGRGQRNPGYFNWNQKPKPTKPKPIRFEGAKILHSPSKSAENAQGQIEGPKFLAYWVQAVGINRTPPMLAKDQVAVFLNTGSNQPPRLIQKVQAVEKDGKIVRIEIRYQSKPKKDEKTSFYHTPENPSSKGILSVAIMKNLKVPIKFIDMTKEEEPEEEVEEEDRDPSKFLGDGKINCEITDLSRFRPASSSGAINTSIQDLEDLENVQKYLDFSRRRTRTLKNVDYEREIVYLTGRAYTNREKALELFQRKIIKVSDLGSSKIRHLVEIEETAESKEENNLESAPRDEKFWFSGHFVVVEKPKEYGGYRFGVTTRNAPTEEEEQE